ncbi:MAG TPA: hypothetical protein PLM41_15495 [Saprospiraceae bacterium]|nr:hypothetical protein [Saprospiraceae bacterium]
MNWQEFEDNLKNRVDGHETPLDTDALWEKVRPRKRRRFVFFWWFFGGICLLGGIGWAVLKHRPSMAAEKGIASQEMLHSTDMASVQQAENASTQAVANIKHPNLPDAVKAEPAHSNVSNSNVAYPGNAEKTGGQNAQKGKNMPGNNNRITPLHPVQPPTNPNNPVVQLVSLLEDTSFVQQDFLHSENDLPGSISTNSAAKQSFLLPDISPEPVSQQDTQVLELLYLDEFSLLPAPVYAVPKRRMQAGAYAGISIWNTLHNGPGGSGIPRPNENLLESVQAGFFAQFPMDNRFVLRAGVQYLQFNSLFRWQKSSIVANQPETVLNYYVDGRVDTSYLPGALMQVDRKVKHYNKLIYINLPVDIQYRIPLGQGAVTPFAGVQPGISIYRKGTIRGLNGLPDAAPFQTIYRRSFALSIRAGVGFERLWRKRVFFIEPTGTFDVIPRTAQGRAVVEQFWQVGINVGMRLR